MSEKSAQGWTDGLSGAERVEAVALTVSEPRTANWIATEAEVAHETATKYLKRLAEDGKLTADTRGQQTTYEPDPVGQYLLEMRELYEEHSPDELAASLEAMNEQIRTWKRDYDKRPQRTPCELGRPVTLRRRRTSQAAPRVGPPPDSPSSRRGCIATLRPISWGAALCLRMNPGVEPSSLSDPLGCTGTTS